MMDLDDSIRKTVILYIYICIYILILFQVLIITLLGDALLFQIKDIFFAFLNIIITDDEQV